MKTVYVLGAGASRAESDAIPLVSDFLEKAFSLGKFNSKEAKEFINDVAKTFGYSEHDLRTGRIDIEQLFSLIDSDIQWERLTSEATGLSARWFGSSTKGSGLEGVIGGVLYQVVPPVFCANSPRHTQLAQAIQPGDTVISFNYDLLIDWALSAANKLNRRGYAIDFFAGTNMNDGWEQPLQQEGDSSTHLLKLHGSLNWLQYVQPESPNKVVYLKNGFELTFSAEDWGPSIQVTETENGNGYLKPFVVPPTADKSRIWAKHGGTLRPLWEKAGEALTDCDRLVVIGYSLREADYQAQWLFRRFLRHKKERSILIVNKDSGHRCRLRGFFSNVGKIEEHISFEDFVAKLAG